MSPVLKNQGSGLAKLSRADSLRLLGTAQIGRAIFTDDALPAILPVAVVLAEEALLLRAADRSPLARLAERHDLLAIEADEIDPETLSGWSVVVTGLAELLDPHDPTPPEASPASGESGVLIRLPATVVTGRRIRALTPVNRP